MAYKHFRCPCARRTKLTLKVGNLYHCPENGQFTLHCNMDQIEPEHFIVSLPCICDKEHKVGDKFEAIRFRRPSPKKPHLH
jgi:hypothetical protein